MWTSCGRNFFQHQEEDLFTIVKRGNLLMEKRFLGFLASLIGSLIIGFDTTFNVYAIPLKSSLNLTHTEVEMVSASGLAGFLMTLSTAVIYELGGPNLMYAIIILGGVGSLALLSTVICHPYFFADSALALSCLHFTTISVLSIAYSYLISVAISNWPLRRSGRIRASIAAASALSHVFYVIVYYNALGQNLKALFPTVAVTYGITMILCSILHRPSAANPAMEEELQLTAKEACDWSEPEPPEPELRLKEKWIHLMSSPKFLLILIPGAIFQGCCLAFMNNITILLKSMNSGVSEELTLTILSLVNALFRLLVGVVLDTKFMETLLRRILLQVLITCVLVLSCCLLIFSGQSPVSVTIATFMAGISMGGGFILPISTLIYIFGQPFYMTIVGCNSLILVVSLFVLQLCIGLIYDKAIDQPSYSAKISLILIIALSATTLVPHVVNLKKEMLPS